jgi:hypothetical protein
MRMVMLAVVAAAMISLTGQARAQTYDPAFPVCMHIGLWGGDWEDCSYHTMAQCAGSASGRGGVCSPNPYYAASRTSPGRRDRPLRRVN